MALYVPHHLRTVGRSDELCALGTSTSDGDLPVNLHAFRCGDVCEVHFQYLVPLHRMVQKSLQHVRGGGDASPQLQKQTPAAEGGLEESMTPEKEKLVKEKSEVEEEKKHVEQMLRQISSDIKEKVCV